MAQPVGYKPKDSEKSSCDKQTQRRNLPNKIAMSWESASRLEDSLSPASYEGANNALSSCKPIILRGLRSNMNPRELKGKWYRCGASKENQDFKKCLTKTCVLLSQTKLLQTDKRWEQGEQEPENKTNDFEVGLESVLTVLTEADWRDLIPEIFQGHRPKGGLNVHGEDGNIPCEGYIDKSLRPPRQPYRTGPEPGFEPANGKCRNYL
ncbi:unnamed protein product [Cyprideis torosa]|uniref:Uncharacterized protein n=1 Tax=Cyprideis torosa TaxID=163714 RepID=A0A7R8WDH0_9CRUS|nr:unnamed protein product [Cyprideis torosa]CAG0894608.1 unnamed protein product [Cyprideis torosa]